MALVLLAVATVIVVIALVGSSGGHAPAHPVVVPPRNGFFARVRMLAGNGSQSFTGAQFAAENAAISRTLSYTPYVRIAGAQHREIALTFDDGPGPYSPQIISILSRENVPGTFFEVGIEEHYFHASTSSIVAHGFPIGDHTETHAPMGQLSADEQRRQLLEQTAAIGRYGAPFPRLFRPPYGLWNSTTLGLLRNYNMLMVLWTVDTDDYLRPGVAKIVHSVLARAKPGAIILLHDAGGDRSQTVAALPLIISQLRTRGYTLVSVPKLLLDNPAPHNQNISAIIGSGG